MPDAASRRGFLGGAALTAASYGRVWGANGRIRLGVIGTGGRGQYLMRESLKTGETEVGAVCDVYTARRDQAATIAGAGVRTYLEHERVLEMKDIDAVIVATPDHWHGPITVDALNAGKDVYVEKPMVHTPEDGQAIVRAARRHKRVVQVGMQARAVPHYQQARTRYVESGRMGRVGLARTWYDANRGYIQTAPAGMERQPEGLDWNRWLGPGPKIAWNPMVYFSPYKWLHYDGGMIMGIGIHVIDTAHQFLKLSKPLSAVAGGGIYLYDDGRDTPDVVNLVLEYPQRLNVTFQAEIFTAGPKTGSTAGVEFRGTGGTLVVDRYSRQVGWRFTPNPSTSAEAPAEGPGDPSSAEWLIKDWLANIRSRGRCVANEEEGYYSSMACYMGNQAYLQKARIVWRMEWDLPA
jgi:predicted dehydrogenase